VKRGGRMAARARLVGLGRRFPIDKDLYRSKFVCFWRNLPRRWFGHPTPAIDPGCVKTPKGRSRRGIVFYRRRGFRVVLQPLATTLVLEKKVILCVPHALAF